MNPEPRPLLVVHVTTVPMTLGFLDGHVASLRSKGIDVHAVSSPGPELEAFGERRGIPVHGVPMSRRITPGRDLVSLVALYRLFRRLRPDVVHAHTPKGGLLGMLAARLAGVPARVYQVHGLPFWTATGARRLISRWSERLSCRLAHRVLCVSHSVREILINFRLCDPGKLRVPGNGSIAGVDANGHFNPDRLGPPERLRIRSGFSIPAGVPVVGFVGRLSREKGIGELASAWQVVRGRHPSAHLLLVGPDEPVDPPPARALEALRADRNVRFAGPRQDVANCLAAMDVFTLPSYREGLGVSIIEAAAMGLPVVSTWAPGCVDAVLDGKTGTLVPERDPGALAEAISGYLDDEGLAGRHGRAGRDWVLRDFRPEPIFEAVAREYSELLEGHRSSPRVGFLMGLKLAAKRALDLAAATLGLLAVAPLLATIALAIRLVMGGPVLFRQVRPGLKGVPFELVKFRTMRDLHDGDGRPLPDGDRLTPLGRALRRSSLDELPQLWNVLKGELSLVGPRPLLTSYLPLYSPDQARRHDIRPGITGWAQVHGRNAIDWESRFRLDVWYVDHWSPWLDLKILAMTVTKVLRAEGISAEGEPTISPFRGSLPEAP